MQYSVILTVYNEERTIAKLVHELEKYLCAERTQTELLIIDDGSTDNSRSIATALIGEYDNIKLIRNHRNLGRGFALKNGVAHAKGKIIGVIDTDLQYSPKDLVAALHAVKKNRTDLVFGRRASNKNTIIRRLLSLGFNILCRTLFSLRIHDANSGVKAGKREIFEDMPLTGGAYRLLGARAAKKYSLDEIRIRHKRRNYGRTRIPTPKILLETLQEITRVYLER